MLFRNLIPGLLLAAVGLAVGASAMWFYIESSRPDTPLGWYDDVFDDSFFEQSRRPFAEIERLRDRLDRLWPGSAEDRFENWFREEFGEFPVSTVRQHDDGDRIYYELDVSGYDTSDVNASVVGNTLSLDVTLSRKEGGLASTQTVQQRMPLPIGVSPDTMRVEHEEDVVRIYFDKIER